MEARRQQHGDALGGEEGQALARAAGRSLEEDRALAVRMGRPESEGQAPGAGYLSRLGRRDGLSPARERTLVAAAQAGDRAARARLVEAFVPAIASVARNYRTAPHVERLELIQEGVVGLLRALERFEPDRGVPLWGYAVFWVRQAMQQLMSELTRPTVLSDRALRQLSRVKDAHHATIAAGDPEPSADELAARSGLTREQVQNLVSADLPARSLEEPVREADGAVGRFGDLLQDPLAEDEYERVLAAMEARELVTLLAGLSDRERDILSARYGLQGEEQSLRQIGARLGMSAERVRQLERRALGKLAAGAGVDTPAERPNDRGAGAGGPGQERT